MKKIGQVAVIIPAAGEGRRLGGHRKQFRVLGGKSVLVQTLLVFERHPLIDHIIVATPEEAVKPLSDELRRVGISKLISVVKGGPSRQATVRSALGSVPEDVDVVLVHDAVRPFVRMSKVSNIVSMVREMGAGSLAINISDTVRSIVRTDQGQVVFGETQPREQLVRMQTPQGFRTDWLVEAHNKAFLEGYEATDDVELVQKLGHLVPRMEGCRLNLKITTPEDWDYANQYWEDWQSILKQEEREQIAGQETR
ncbi:MAG: 2-C-methyl-D-erythritol 4-phosphate cytidylyltransferase [Bacteroidetes bacterium]|nr:2-C-methyl-D-erythritol 4-phosphate cytidylyltransferase [Bacteroidota bacterium]